MSDEYAIERVQLMIDTMPYAEKLYNQLRDDVNFHHFRHTTPPDMLGDNWEVYMTLWGGIPVAWGQIQKFMRPSKQHVVRLGFAVPVEFRGRRFGSGMVDYILDKCASYDKLTATTFSDNIIMLSMFLRRSFIVEGCFVDEERDDGGMRNVLSLARYQY